MLLARLFSYPTRIEPGSAVTIADPWANAPITASTPHSKDGGEAVTSSPDRPGVLSRTSTTKGGPSRTASTHNRLAGTRTRDHARRYVYHTDDDDWDQPGREYVREVMDDRARSAGQNIV